MIPNPNHIDDFVESHLQRYATAYFADSSPYSMSGIEKDADEFAKRLDPVHRQPFAHLRKLLNAESLPAWSTFSPSYRFGIDLEREGHAYSLSKPLRFWEQEQDWRENAFALGTDGSGILSVLLTDGRLAQMWDEDCRVLGDAYVDLNTFLFASICVAITPAVLSYDDCIALLKPIEGAEPYIDELAEAME